MADFAQERGRSPHLPRNTKSFPIFFFSFSLQRYVQVLKRKGFFQNESRGPITLAPITFKESGEEIQLPFVGTIAQGFPIETFPQSKTVAIPTALVHDKENTYVLKAKGETLIAERIADGDLLIVEARQEAHFGEIVLASLNQHETIIKRYYPESTYVRLEGSHDQHHPIMLRKDQITIVGVLVGLIHIYV